MPQRILAGVFALVVVGLVAGAPAVKPKDEGPPLGRFKFDGNATNTGTGKATFRLKNTRFKDDALVLNGLYIGTKPDGYTAECATPTLDYNQFAVALRARAEDFAGKNRNLITGGRSYRWFGLQRSEGGELTVTFNNGEVRHEFKGAGLEAGGWFTVACAVDLSKRTVRAYLNGKAAGEFELPKAFAFEVATSEVKEADKVWTFTNYSNGNVFHGLVDELLIYDRALTPAELTALPLKK
jgi:hypothetical protein